MGATSSIQGCLILFSLFLSSYCNAAFAEHLECPNIITKSMWGGRSTPDGDVLNIPVEYVIIEHTVTPECHTITACSDRVTSIQDYHMNIKKFPDIGYNFLIGSDGNVYEGVGWHKAGTHSRSWNSKGLGIAFIGDYSEKLPPQKAMDVAQAFFRCGVLYGALTANYKLIGHRQAIQTQSPGNSLYQQITTWPHFTQDP